MSNICNSITRNIPALDVLAMLGLPRPRPGYPALSKCPICSQDFCLWVNLDDLCGHWLHCTGCGFSGDLVEPRGGSLEEPCGDRVAEN